MPASDGGGACCSPASPAQRPYDIHSSSAVESLVQLFSTVSVQYVPAWSKETVALLRKVSARPHGERGGGHGGRRAAQSVWPGTAPSQGPLGRVCLLLGSLPGPAPGSSSCCGAACVSAGAAVSPYDLIKASRPLPSLTPQLGAGHPRVCRGGGRGLVPLRPGSSCRRWAATVRWQWPGQTPHQKRAGETPEPPACPGPRGLSLYRPEAVVLRLLFPSRGPGWAGVTPRPAS